MLRPRDEAQGSEAAAVLRLTPARYILTNARVRTLDPDGGCVRAVAVGASGVLALGSMATMRGYRVADTEVIDCEGAAVLPGLIDPHLHLFALAAASAHLDCRRLTQVGALLAAIAARAQRLPAGAWVRGEGVDEAGLDRLPTPAELDRAAGGRPVRLRHRSLHASLLSGRALRRLGSARGHLVGSSLVVGQEEALRAVVGPLPAAVLRDGFRAVGRALAQRGLTTVADATPRTRRSVAPLRDAIGVGDFRLRVFAMRAPGTAEWSANDRLRCGPMKIVLHEEGAELRPTPAVLARLVARAATAGYAVAVHCLGAHALVAALEAFARVPRRWRAGRGHRLEHVAECPPALIAEIARLGLMVVSNPAFIWERGDVYRRESDPATHGWLYRARSLRRAGITMAAGSDAPVAVADPWRAMATARARRTRRGYVLGPREQLTAREALALCTTGAAAALQAPGLGRLRVGGPADLIVVDRDPLRTTPHELAAARVQLTMVGGEIVWRR